MQQNNVGFHWIIMADIIDSGLMDGVLLQSQFKECVEKANEKFAKKILSTLTITLGDEFQGIIKSLADGINIVLFMEEYALKQGYDFRLRYVINYGKIDTPINAEIAYGMLGEGLSTAREQLNSLKKTELRFWFHTHIKAKTEALIHAFTLYDAIVSKWTSPADKQLASAFIKDNDYKIVAEKLEKDRSQIWRRKNSLEISSYFAIKNLINYIAK